MTTENNDNQSQDALPTPSDHELSASDDASDGGMVMPPATKETSSAVQENLVSAGDVGDGEVPPPPSFGRQMAQLIVIPALIVMVAIGAFFLFGIVAANSDNVDDLLARLKQPAGYGKDLPAGMQDPRYKDRWLAAMTLSTVIQKVESQEEKQRINQALTLVLKENVGDHEGKLIQWLLIAVGRLGQDGGLDILVDRVDFNLEGAAANDPRTPKVSAVSGNLVREGAIVGIMSWADEDEARSAALDSLVARLSDPYDTVRTLAASAIFKLAIKADPKLIEALRQAAKTMGQDSGGRDFTHSRRHANLALAALGDAEASQFVVETLLNRDALAKLAPESGSTETMNENDQEAVMAATMFFIPKMKDKRVWDRVSELAENDSSINIRNGAIKLLELKKKQDSGKSIE